MKLEDHFLHKILHPRSIAFYGANDDIIGTMGTFQMLNLLDQGYPGKVYPIHPRLDEVLGLKAYRNIADVPEVPDLAFLVLPTRVIPQVMEELGEKGVDRAVMVTAGFREVGDEDGERRLKEIADRYGIRFVGPNCIGVFNTHLDPSNPGAFMNTTWVHYPGVQGNVSIATQSGTFACHIFMVADELGFKMSKAVSVGNEANIDICDCMEYFRDDPTTDVILLYIEEVKRGRRFLELAREISPRKPIVAMYVGGTSGGARAVASHTGSMAGIDEVFDAAFSQAGVQRVYTFQELLATAALFSDYAPRGVFPKGRRLAVVTNSGGTGASMSDLATRLGFQIPDFSEKLQRNLAKKLPPTAGYSNPVDFTFALNPETYFDGVPRQIYRSGEVDAIVAYGAFGPDFFRQMGPFGSEYVNSPEGQKGMADYNEMLGAILNRISRYPEKFGVPVAYINPMGMSDGIGAKLRERGIPYFRYPDQAVRAMYHLANYGVFRNSRACERERGKNSSPDPTSG
ncbi:MAG: acetate--CoA ligase family protein [Promethearchaeota archaeon]